PTTCTCIRGSWAHEIWVPNALRELRHAGGRPFFMGGRFICSCGRPAWKHIRTLLRCYEPRGSMSCGSPMPRGEQIAKPTERDTRLVGLCFTAAGQEWRWWLWCWRDDGPLATDARSHAPM